MMKSIHETLLSRKGALTIALSGMLLGALIPGKLMAVDGYTDTPIVPGTKWHVHDPNRPQPEVVTPQGCVVVAPPSDAKVLFDGKSTDSWNALGKQRKMWPVKNGVMVASYNDIETKEKFGDVQVHLEWMAPNERKEPGQKDMNSGVMFLGGEFEVQILNSYKNDTYPDGSAGSLYGQFPPLVNAGLPKGQWQSYDIIFTAPKFKDGKLVEPARATVIRNGVVVQNAQAFHGPTGHKHVGQYRANMAVTGPIKLQHHSDPVHFRNIWVRELKPRTDVNPE